MPTVIDTLVLELGLDPAKFTAGQRQTMDSLRQMQQQLEKGGKEIDAQGQKTQQFFSTLKTQALGFTAAFLGGRGVKEFVQFVTHADAAVGKLAYTTNMTAKDVSTWQGVLRQAGGTAENASATLQGLTDKLATFALTGQGDFLPIFNAMGISMKNANGEMKTAGELLFDINHAVQGMDPARARALMLGLGFDPATINSMLLGEKALRGIYDQAAKNARVSKESAEAATKLGQTWDNLVQSAEKLGDKIYTKLAPALTVFAGLANFGVDWVSNKLFGTEMKTEATPSALPQKGGGASTAEREAYIRKAAAARGIDPNIAVAVAKSEGLGGSYAGDHGSSFGDFQLLYGGMAGGGMAVGGLGDKFTKRTGLDAKDPSTWQQQTDFALDEAKRSGWGAWHGWKGLPRAGLDGGSVGAGSAAGGATTNVTNTTTVGAINVYPPNGDADTIARTIKPAMDRANFAGSANYGQN